VKPPRVSFAIKAGIAGVLPLLACSTYYTVERVVDAGPWFYGAAAMAPTVLLIGLAGGASLLASGRRSGLLLWAAGAAVLGPAALLVAIWR
jgi:hypothetical protein